ncbi:hypothetical protein EJ05DRAFT_509356 [Pseudovirgaria hyperparasitica]|uniref:Uncharacterized protein n=1 Tax=Pseudovirgaria hyperparasitica TaxID=470096 RepID=A0A6A6WAN2_9PEZI|nr:uncharacterized protein EJ05DRAFT_509356 [Pseudovirgaria hyperparasitica]KAF2759625.1 hypothetical protein EJ05DRAFT_509356 [Pseudovirgaria hyperparasitica]
MSSPNQPTTTTTNNTITHTLKAWGNNPIPPTLTATLITAQHLRPLRILPLTFVPVFIFSSYINVGGDFKVDSAGLTGAWSALLCGRDAEAVFGTGGGARGDGGVVCG